jgi:hypothetical protein
MMPKDKCTIRVAELQVRMRENRPFRSARSGARKIGLVAKFVQLRPSGGIMDFRRTITLTGVMAGFAADARIIKAGAQK